MELEHLKTLSDFAEKLRADMEKQAPHEGKDPSTWGPMGILSKTGADAILEAIAGIKDEVRKTHLYATETEARTLDGFVAAALSGGADVPTAFRTAMQVMTARAQLVDQRVDSLMEGKEEEKEDDNG